MAIHVGDNGSVLRFRLFDRGEKVPLTDAAVTATLKNGATTSNKTATINGEWCLITLSSADIPTAGTYELKPTVTYGDGRKFNASPQSFPVEE